MSEKTNGEHKNAPRPPWPMTPSTSFALLLTRCGCTKKLVLPYPPPSVVTIDLTPIAGGVLGPGGQPIKEIRTFAPAAVQPGATKDAGQVIIYEEVPNA